MKRFLYALIVLLWTLPAFAQVPMTGAGVGAPGGGGGSGCANSSQFIGRVTVDATHQTAYETLICTCIGSTIFAKLGVFAIFNTQSAATALTNIISSSFPFTNVGSLAFTADHGYAATTSSAFLTTTFAETASGSQWTNTSASLGIWSRTAAQVSGVAWGDNGGNTRLIARFTDDKTYLNIDDTNFDATTVANLTGDGLIAGDRTGTTTTIYRNGASLGTGTVSFSQAASATTWQTGNNAAASVSHAMVFAGQHLTGTEHATINTCYAAWNTTISGGNP